MRAAFGAVVTVVSLLTCLVAGWMVMMYFVLRHPGYQWRALIAAAILGGAATVIASVADLWQPGPPYRVTIGLWAVGLTALGASAFFSRDPRIDMWQLVAGLLFMLQGPLTLLASNLRTRT